MLENAKPIIPWIGGKRRLAKNILPLFPEHTCYVEPFCGAAAIYFMKKPVKVEVINDIHGELVNLYRVVQHQGTSKNPALLSARYNERLSPA